MAFKKKKKDLYKEITNKILESLDNGVAPWVKNWKTEDIHAPHNGITGKAYSGINFILMSIEQRVRGYDSSKWMTFKQGSELEGHVRKGEKGTTGIYFNMISKKDNVTLTKSEEKKLIDSDSNSDVKKFALIRSFAVFNESQFDDLKASQDDLNEIEISRKALSGIKINDIVSALIDHSPAGIVAGTLNYNSKSNIISLPSEDSFEDPDDYMRSSIKGLLYATSHEDALNRDPSKKNFEAIEAMIVDVASAQIQSKLGIDGVHDDKYIKEWGNLLRDNDRLFFNVSSQAQKASDLVLNEALEQLLSIDDELDFGM